MSAQHTTPKRRPGRPPKHQVKPKQARGRPPKSNMELRRDAWVALVIQELRGAGWTYRASCQFVADWLDTELTTQECRGFKKRNFAHLGYSRTPSARAVEIRVRRLLKTVKGEAAANAIGSPPPAIRRLPPGEDRARAMLNNLLDQHYRPDWKNAFKGPVKRVMTINFGDAGSAQLGPK